MNIQMARLEKMEKVRFSTTEIDGVCHIKTLPYLSIVQAVEGRYEIALKDGPLVDTGNGGFFVAPAGVKQTIVHHVDPHTGQFTGRFVFLDVTVNNALRLDDMFHLPVVLNETEKQAMNNAFDRLFEAKTVFEEYQHTYEILDILARNATERTSVSADMQAVLAYIRLHYAEKIRIEQLAVLSGLSSSRLFVTFKAATGCSPIAYLNNYRLSMAAERLIRTDDSIADIARCVGIEDAVYFNKQFRKQYAVSPSAYRRLHKENGL